MLDLERELFELNRQVDGDEPDAPRELPYPGAKPMLLVEEVDRKEFLTELIQAMEPELPAPKRRRKPDAFSR